MGEILDQTSKKYLRIMFALVLSYLLCPWIFGGGWALVNIGLMGTHVASNPQIKEQIEKTPKESEENKQLFNTMIKSHAPKAVFYLSIGAFAIFGLLYGLLGNDWKLAFIVFGITIIRGNPIFYKVTLPLFSKVGIALLQLVLLYGFAFLFSRITFGKKAESESQQS